MKDMKHAGDKQKDVIATKPNKILKHLRNIWMLEAHTIIKYCERRNQRLVSDTFY